MARKMTEMSITARTLQFAMLLERCEITAKNGSAYKLEAGMNAAIHTLEQARSRHNMVYVIGNGGSASIASHTVNDLINVAKLRATTLHDSSLLSCMANDYGYENAFARILSQMAQPQDVLIAISSSGNSMNIRKAAQEVTQRGGQVITLSGFAPDNALRSLGDINIWLDSSDYGLVEVGHQFILHNISDRFGHAAVVATRKEKEKRKGVSCVTAVMKTRHHEQ